MYAVAVFVVPKEAVRQLDDIGILVKEPPKHMINKRYAEAY